MEAVSHISLNTHTHVSSGKRASLAPEGKRKEYQQSNKPPPHKLSRPTTCYKALLLATLINKSVAQLEPGRVLLRDSKTFTRI